MTPIADFVSIIIPTKDRWPIIAETLDSILRQTNPNWEVIVVDDGSQPSHMEGLRAYVAPHPRIRLVSRTSTASGAPVCRNEGLRLARGRFVLFLDSDDLLDPECLSQRVALLQRHPHLAFCVFQCEIFTERPGDLGKLLNVTKPDDDLNRFLEFDFPWHISCLLWTRAALDSLGAWDEELYVLQDFELSVRALARNFAYQKVEVVDFYWRVYLKMGSNVSSRLVSPLGVQSTFAYLRRLHDLLGETGALSPERAHRMASFYLRIAMHAMQLGLHPLAREILAQARQLQLITPLQFWMGLFYLGFPVGRRASYALLKRVWLKSMVPRNSQTLRKINRG